MCSHRFSSVRYPTTGSTRHVIKTTERCYKSALLLWVQLLSVVQHSTGIHKIPSSVPAGYL